MPKVSVIMPSLNVVDYIDKSITSVRNQILKDIEIICIDAGSTDGTRDIIEKHSQIDSRIIVIDSDVKSYGYQVNKAIRASSGEYICILETDDFVDQNMYDLLYNIAHGLDLDYVKCDYSTYYYDSNGEMVFSYRKVSSDNNLYNTIFSPSDYPSTACEDWYLWNGIYKADFISKNGIMFSETPGAAFQDIGFLHKTASFAERVKYVDCSLYRYCIGRNEASSKSNNTIKYIRQEYGFLMNGIKPETGKKELALLYRRLAKSFTRACIDSDDKTLNNKDIISICEWFLIIMNDAKEKGYLSSEMLPSGLRESFIVLIDSSQDYVKYRKARKQRIEKFVRISNPLIIFGCGVRGRETLDELISLGYTPNYFMDNSKDLWGRKICGVDVISSKEILRLPDSTGYIIANENYADEIFEQLISKVEKEQIFII